MTLEQANAATLNASMSGDMQALTRALADRGDAIRELAAEPPSEQLAMRLRNAIGAGEFVGRDLYWITSRIAALRSRFAPEHSPDPILNLVG